jgi:LysM repeat protein
MRRFLLNSFSILLILTLTFSSTPRPAAASSISAYELIAWANNLRTGTYGLSALNEDSIIDSSAQWTAETMAASGVCAHLASQGYPGVRDRLVNFGYGGGQTVWATENMACGTSLTIDSVSGYWDDPDHMRPAVDSSYQDVGAGVAVGSNGWTYVVLQAAYVAGGNPSKPASTSVGATDEVSTSNVVSQWLSPVITSTPNFDGYIYHKVLSGQTLFYIALAYNVTVDYIKEQNGLTSNDIYEGQTLKIKQAPTPTPTSTFTPTPIYPTRTPTLKVAAVTPTPLPTMTATPVPSLVDKLPKLDRQLLGLILVILSGLGLVTALLFNFIKPKKKE